jgi:hypothetical protein
MAAGQERLLRVWSLLVCSDWTKLPLIVGTVCNDDFRSIHPANVFWFLHCRGHHRLRQIENVDPATDGSVVRPAAADVRQPPRLWRPRIDDPPDGGAF